MSAEAPPRGLRARKKQQTRTAIADAAMRLFAERGFDDVTVAEVARTAEVSEATVFNYFGTKEDLVFHRLDEFWARLVGAVESRPAGSGVVDALERFLLDQEPTALGPGQAERLTTINRMIAGSPGLLARERASYDRAAIRLADVIASTTAVRADALTAAHMLLGVHRSLVAYTRELLLDGVPPGALARHVAARTRSGYALLRNGMDL